MAFRDKTNLWYKTILKDLSRELLANSVAERGSILMSVAMLKKWMPRAKALGAFHRHAKFSILQAMEC